LKKTYYIGAGASYHSLPLVSSIPKRMRVFYNYVEHRYKAGKLLNKFTETYLKDLEKLINETENSTSIDSYAKELYNGNRQLEHLKLKAILAGYLVFEQLEKSEEFLEYASKKLEPEIAKEITNQIDKRYRTFWAEKLTKINNLPNSNLSIISWNYDMQFETSYSRMFGFSYKMSQQNLNVYPSELTSNQEGFSLIKLNGTAGLLRAYGSSSNQYLFYLESDKTTDQTLDYIIKHLEENYHRSFANPILNFAWENEGDVAIARQLAKSKMLETEKLIIIGYSFPIYNREVDIEILGQANNLKEIIYQCPAADLDIYRNELNKINNKFRNITIANTNLGTFAN